MATPGGLSVLEVYAAKCEALGCKKNSALLKQLPSVPGAQDDLQELELGDNFVGPKGLLPVLEVVRLCKNLARFSLRDNQLTNQAVIDLCDVVVGHPGLRALDLSNNPITLSAGKALLRLVTANRHLQQVALDNTSIRPVVVASIRAQCDRNATPPPLPAGLRAIAAAPTSNGPATLPAAPQTLDVEVARQLLAAAPHSVAPILLDVDPVDSLLLLCEQHRVKFEDPQFPPTGDSISPARPGAYGVDRWRRVTDIFEAPVLFCDKEIPGVDAVAMGAMNSSAVLAALSETFRKSASENPLLDLFYPRRVSPHGVYSVKLFINGKWRFVVIDDYIPCIAGLPAFLQQPESNSVWVMLLEKAVAKVHRCYEALDTESPLLNPPPACPVSAAALMEDLTAGVALSRDLRHEDFDADRWWTMLEESLGQGCLCAAQCAPGPAAELEAQGLGPNCAYTVLYARAIGDHRLICLGNSWLADEFLWTGPWAAKSELWAENPGLAQELAALRFPSGQRTFWMALPDFLRTFVTVSLCRPFPDHVAVALEGRWEGPGAGGPYFANSWCHNPRYEIRVEEPSTLFVQLALPDSRFNPPTVDALGIQLIRSEYYPLRFDPDECTAKTAYVISDAVIFEAVVSKGLYWLVPSTYTPGQESHFILRAFCTKRVTVMRQLLSPFWKEKRLTSRWDMSGEYQHGDDNPQFRLVIPHPKEPTTTTGPADPNRFTVRTSLTLEVEKGPEVSIIMFICLADTDERLCGFIPDELILARSKFLVSDSVTLTTALGPGAYTVVCCLQPEGAASRCDLSVWCSRTDFTVKELPFWNKQILRSTWLSSGVYQSADHQPQFELVVPQERPSRWVIKAMVTDCNDPAIMIFLCDNCTNSGKRMVGAIPDDKVVAKSLYVRADSVSFEFTVTRPASSYLIIPCLQPPGSKGTLQLSISTPSDAFQVRELVE